MERERPEFDDWVMELLETVRKRSTCIRRQHAAIIVKDKQIIGTGYNGAPRNCPHCTKETCLREKMNIPSGERTELCRGAHAEQNAIAQCAKYGVSTKDAVMYITGYPCVMCIKSIINAGIDNIIVGGTFSGDNTLTLQLIKESGIICEEYRHESTGRNNRIS